MSNNKETEQNTENNGDIWIKSPVTQEELDSIAKALANDLEGSGHCYTCPNGHPYVVGSCGTPIEVDECLICKEKIGGEEYLVQNNKFDLEMDKLVAKHQEEKYKEN